MTGPRGSHPQPPKDQPWFPDNRKISRRSGATAVAAFMTVCNCASLKLIMRRPGRLYQSSGQTMRFAVAH